MKKNLHTDSFDKLLQSKFHDEWAEPPDQLWSRIQRNITVTTRSKTSWAQSGRTLAISIISAAAIIAGLFLFILHPKSFFNAPTKATSGLGNTSLKDTSQYNNGNLKENFLPTNSPVNITKNTQVAISTEKMNLSRSLQEAAKKKIAFMNGRKNYHDINHIKKNSTSRKEREKTSSKEKQKSLKKVVNFVSAKHISFPITLVTGAKIKEGPVSPSVHGGIAGKAVASKKNKKKGNRFDKDKLSLEIFLMPEYSYRIVTSNPANTSTQYTPSYFNNRDKYKFTYSYGLLIGYQIHPKLILETGLSYYSYAIRFSTLSSYLIKNSSQNFLIYTSAGPVSLFISNIDGMNVQSFLKSSIRFSYLSVPIIIKYYPFKNLFLDAGTSLDFMISENDAWNIEDYHGNFELQANKINGIEPFNVSLIFGLGYERTLSQNLSLSVNPIIRLHITNLNKKSTVKSFPYNTGFRISLKYYLN